jgi:hypothetical protein
VRVVVGWWPVSPFGPFADVMLERADGHRVLLAPGGEVADLVSTTYTFDEVRGEPVSVVVSSPGVRRGGPAESWAVRSPSLWLDLVVGGRTGLGRALRTVPQVVAGSPAFATVADPVARVVLRGVRTRGAARAGRREYYGATDVREVVAASGSFDGADLGALAPVDPPCRFGFSSTPRRPSVTDVVTTLVDTR